jgi:NTP pyrophosphatase (non-canonical NTP hydrolase)
MNKMKLQREEFHAASIFADAVRAHSVTPIVDDDYPEVRGRYELALRSLLDAVRRNGHLMSLNTQETSALSFADLRIANIKRCARWHPGGVEGWSLSDWFTATMGELGEAANVAKKLNRDRDGLTGNTQEVSELGQCLADELADTLIYLDLTAAHQGIDLAVAVIAKFNATSEKNGFPDRLPAVSS